MPIEGFTLNGLTRQYQDWNKQQGLNLGSADEHVFDESLSDEQRQWLTDFCRLWENAARIERAATKAGRMVVTNDAFIYVWGPYDWTIIGPFPTEGDAVLWGEKRFADRSCEFAAARACKPDDYPPDRE